MTPSNSAVLPWRCSQKLGSKLSFATPGSSKRRLARRAVTGPMCNFNCSRLHMTAQRLAMTEFVEGCTSPNRRSDAEASKRLTKTSAELPKAPQSCQTSSSDLRAAACFSRASLVWIRRSGFAVPVQSAADDRSDRQINARLFAVSTARVISCSIVVGSTDNSSN